MTQSFIWLVLNAFFLHQTLLKFNRNPGSTSSPDRDVGEFNTSASRSEGYYLINTPDMTHCTSDGLKARSLPPIRSAAFPVVVGMRTTVNSLNFVWKTVLVLGRFYIPLVGVTDLPSSRFRNTA
ncbi:hypothetical protein [Allocoleopsis franciscana]|uniref:hypothetical protein n=1 Tax=Allocoleopsis franciscana TaxID=2886352 RepID=UPI0012DC03F9|nr:hypothetical protein [Allocoleopsis franciscana]